MLGTQLVLWVGGVEGSATHPNGIVSSRSALRTGGLISSDIQEMPCPCRIFATANTAFDFDHMPIVLANINLSC